MFFNSLDFSVFLPIVFLLYWLVFNKNIKRQSLLLLIASYVFYGWWDWRFLFLMLFSTIVDYSIAKKMYLEQDKIKRKKYLWISICINIGLLGYFKYVNFFIDSFNNTFLFFGGEYIVDSLSIVLPVGISFYTFQTLSYTIDVYKKKLIPVNNFISFAAFVSFFPQLVAGPIERASNLLPQFLEKREFDVEKAIDGLKQVLWGLFKKIVIADNCAIVANEIFNNSGNYTGSELFLGVFFFAFQIYGDFSGYSDIAIGISRLFGFNLIQNFNFPYFSRDVAEFWRRWHISLSTWFRDYVYIPLGGSRLGKKKAVFNTFVIFVVSGFWHGSNWTFVAWGFLNACYFLPLLLLGSNRNHIDTVAKDSLLPSVKEMFKIIFTFCLILISWVFFRAEDITHALEYIRDMISIDLIHKPKYSIIKISVLPLLGVVFFICIEWIGRRGKYAIESIVKKRMLFFRYCFYLLLIVIIILAIPENGTIKEFIYFQF